MSGPKIPDPYLHLDLSLFLRRHTNVGPDGASNETIAIAKLWILRARARFSEFVRRGRRQCVVAAPKGIRQVVTGTSRGAPGRLVLWLVIELDVEAQ